MIILHHHSQAKVIYCNETSPTLDRFWLLAARGRRDTTFSQAKRQRPEYKGRTPGTYPRTPYCKPEEFHIPLSLYNTEPVWYRTISFDLEEVNLKNREFDISPPAEYRNVSLASEQRPAIVVWSSFFRLLFRKTVSIYKVCTKRFDIL